MTTQNPSNSNNISAWAQAEALRSDVGAIAHELMRDGHDFQIETVGDRALVLIRTNADQNTLDELLNETYRSVIFTTTVKDIREFAYDANIEIDGANEAGLVLDLLRHDDGLKQEYNEHVLAALKTEVCRATCSGPQQ